MKTNHHPFNPYKAQVALGIIMAMIIILFMAVSQCQAQTYACEVSAMNGMNVKMQMEIIVNDSTVSISSGGQQVNYDRKASTTGIYFTDQVITSSMTVFPKEGRIKGFAYNAMVTIIPNITAPTVSSTQYCWKKN